MHINLPDLIPTGNLRDDLAMVVDELLEHDVTSLSGVRITLRAFNRDNREMYPADETGHHNMGFTLKRPAPPNSEDLREVSWTYREPKPEPKAPPLGELRGLQALLGEVPKRDGA